MHTNGVLIVVDNLWTTCSTSTSSPTSSTVAGIPVLQVKGSGRALTRGFRLIEAGARRRIVSAAASVGACSMWGDAAATAPPHDARQQPRAVATRPNRVRTTEEPPVSLTHSYDETKRKPPTWAFVLAVLFAAMAAVIAGLAAAGDPGPRLRSDLGRRDVRGRLRDGPGDVLVHGLPRWRSSGVTPASSARTGCGQE